MSELAEKRLQAGLDCVARGHIVRARDHFKASSEECPTAEAFTYWGWMEHHLGNTDLAIDLCHRAIETDPDFGNPYNDIGSYLISRGQLDEAIPWLEKAVAAKRYEPKHYPHINLGKIYAAKDMPVKALAEFDAALTLVPDDTELAKTAEILRQSIN